MPPAEAPIATMGYGLLLLTLLSLVVGFFELAFRGAANLAISNYF
jgi:hypothetical protein